ncbi:hypothetical protein [Nocardia niwae]|uniref:Uncharacterized protein n=1 Tax=Nocardia niwae TaxID=626084 RepID=A0ABV2X5Z1_9NOCA|nr:hypothetical protein [Nocardia niwae]
MKKLYAPMMKAACPIDPETMATTMPFLQHEIVPHAMADPGRPADLLRRSAGRHGLLDHDLRHARRPRQRDA